MKGTTFGTKPNPLFKGGYRQGIDPVGGEFQPPLEAGCPGGGDYLIFVLKLGSFLPTKREMNLNCH
jgi:hypothetical protein